MSEHTKGTATAIPWSIREDGRFAPVIVGADQRRIVGDVLYDAPDPQDKETMANAELIVLAVNTHAELVEALKWAMKHVSKHGTYTYEDNYRKAKAALRKAGAL